MQLGGCHNTQLEADSEKKYLDLNEIGVTVLIGPEKAMILLDISQAFQDPVSIINYSMDEHDLVLKSPTQNPIDICDVATTDRKERDCPSTGSDSACDIL